MTADYLEERAKRGRRAKFERAKGKMKDGKPATGTGTRTIRASG